MLSSLEARLCPQRRVPVPKDDTFSEQSPLDLWKSFCYIGLGIWNIRQTINIGESAYPFLHHDD